jgi:hypothetical protein
VLDGIQGFPRWLGGNAAHDAVCAPCWSIALMRWPRGRDGSHPKQSRSGQGIIEMLKPLLFEVSLPIKRRFATGIICLADAVIGATASLS